ncbi:hypothetical protein QSJ18_05925 [Gordonia sp. ABSL1-1]|uniref:hypothetical protein n=1 Tax=Gordonia sp. ABSL1-1 TaxID=3053923 RepID=UPI00257263EC|nr:hypothetical protein [Gordonia sp. ABSL1-1]MDL9936275.1 hypothetical protein [Gordonia sp. ABSL1-1]
MGYPNNPNNPNNPYQPPVPPQQPPVPPQQPGWGPPPPQPPAGGKKKAWWIGGLIGLVAIIAIVAVVLALTLGGDDSDDDNASPTPSGTSAQPAPAASATSILLPESAFPSLPDGKFSTETGPSSDDSDVRVDNAACEKFFKSPDSTADQATRELKSEQSSSRSLKTVSYEAKVTKEVDPSYTTDFDSIIGACSNVTLYIDNDGTEIPVQVTMEKVTAPGIDGDYKGVLIKGQFETSGIAFKMENTMLLGVTDGVSFRTGYSFLGTSDQSSDSDATATMATMFNQQRKLIADAQ